MPERRSSDVHRCRTPVTREPGSAGRWPAWCGGRVEPIVWRISTPWVGAGFKPAPTMHAVTGMIGATPAGERVHIAPGSAGLWPACDCRSLGEEPESTGLWPARECEGRFGMPCRVKVVPCPCCRTHLASPTGSIPGEELGVCASHTSHHLHSLSAAETQASAAS